MNQSPRQTILPVDMAHLQHIWNEPHADKPENLRRHGRVKCQDIRCTLGEVQDLSASGLRVVRKGRAPVRPDETFSITIHTLDGPMLAPVRVAWVRKVGWRHHEIGLTFHEIGPELSRALASIARRTAHNETMVRDPDDRPHSEVRAA